MKNKIYMGWDSKEPLAYDVAKWSFLQNSPKSQIIPLEIGKLSHLLTRKLEVKDGIAWCPISEAPVTTEFSFTRFLVPHLNNYKGWAMFIDCDVVNLTDVSKLFEQIDDKYAVMVVKHTYESKHDMHMVNIPNAKLPRKNWASMILFNCTHPSNKKIMEVVNTWPGRDLHQFKWLQDEEIGSIDQSWNFLIDENQGDTINIAHYTLGGPWIPGWEARDSDKLWNDTYQKYLGK